MPYIIRPNRIRRLAAGALGTAALLAASPAVAGAAQSSASSSSSTSGTTSTACPTTASSNALAAYGDESAYSLLTGAGFETTPTGWTLSNAEVIKGAGANGSTGSLEIKAGGQAISPQFCVSAEYPSFRFFVHLLSAQLPLNQMVVTLRWNGPLGLTLSNLGTLVQAGNSWTLSPVMDLANALPVPKGGSLKVSIGFQAVLGTFAIDDVLIDPYSR